MFIFSIRVYLQLKKKWTSKSRIRFSSSSNFHKSNAVVERVKTTTATKSTVPSILIEPWWASRFLLSVRRPTHQSLLSVTKHSSSNHERSRVLDQRSTKERMTIGIVADMHDRRRRRLSMAVLWQQVNRIPHTILINVVYRLTWRIIVPDYWHATRRLWLLWFVQRRSWWRAAAAAVADRCFRKRGRANER